MPIQKLIEANFDEFLLVLLSQQGTSERRLPFLGLLIVQHNCELDLNRLEPLPLKVRDLSSEKPVR